MGADGIRLEVFKDFHFQDFQEKTLPSPLILFFSQVYCPTVGVSCALARLSTWIEVGLVIDTNILASGSLVKIHKSIA